MRNERLFGKLGVILGLLAFAGFGMFAEKAEAQIRQKIGKALVEVEPIQCQVVMKILPNPNYLEYATLARSCKAKGVVSKAKKGKATKGKILVQAPTSAKFTVYTIDHDGTVLTGTASGIPPIKFHLKFLKYGNGKFALSGEIPGTVISKSKFIAFKKALGLGKDEVGQTRTLLKAKFLNISGNQPVKDAGVIETTVS
jgi:hypothetical protein